MRTARRLLSCSAFVLFFAPVTLRADGTAFINNNGGAAAPPHLSTAQGPPTQGRAHRYDEFGDILITTWLAAADNFAIELQNNPGAKGYIVAYGVPNDFPGWPFRRAYQIKGYMLRNRTLDASRVEVLYAGYREEVLFQLWVVEPGAQLPFPSFDFAAALAREKTPLLFDRFGWFPLNPAHTDIEYGYIGYLDERGRYEGFVQALRSDPSLRGCVIAYPSRRDRRGADRRLAARIKRDILTNHAIGAGRVVALAGGYRHPYQTAELWLVPPGSPMPQPTRYVAPPKRRGSR